MTRTRIGILFGGRSEEHPVSIKSAREVAASLDPERYDPVWVGITREGAWLLCEEPDALERGAGRPVALAADPGVRGLVLPGGEGESTEIPLDVVLPVLHGRFGEDGAVQGLLELSGIPYVGCGVAASALSFDKALTYAVVSSAGIATPAFRRVGRGESLDPARVEYPVFVKPARSGSSFGVTKVERPEELGRAVEAAREFDDVVLVEEAVVGSEIGCAVLGDETGLVLGELDRVALTSGFFRIHQEASPETGSENSTFIVPADISEEAALLIRVTAQTVYRALGCRGLARVDLFLRPEGTVVLNEVNTLPGLTSYSRYPRMMAAAGLSLAEVLDRLVALALPEASR
jgi:D-alanine--(R)-lactate ligase